MLADIKTIENAKSMIGGIRLYITDESLDKIYATLKEIEERSVMAIFSKGYETYPLPKVESQTEEVAQAIKDYEKVDQVLLDLVNTAAKARGGVKEVGKEAAKIGKKIKIPVDSSQVNVASDKLQKLNAEIAKVPEYRASLKVDDAAISKAKDAFGKLGEIITETLTDPETGKSYRKFSIKGDTQDAIAQTEALGDVITRTIGPDGVITYTARPAAEIDAAVIESSKRIAGYIQSAKEKAVEFGTSFRDALREIGVQSKRVTDDSKAEYMDLIRRIKESPVEVGVGGENKFKAFLSTVDTGLTKASEWFMSFWSTTESDYAETVQTIKDNPITIDAVKAATFDPVIKAIKDSITSLIEWAKKNPVIIYSEGVGGSSPSEGSDAPTMRKGGFLGGYGGGDRIPAWLESGEGIIRKEAVRHYGGRDFIDTVNKLKLRLSEIPAAISRNIGSITNSDSIPFKAQYGGVVQSFPDLGTVKIQVGQKAFPVLAKQNVVEELRTALLREQLLRNN